MAKALVGGLISKGVSSAHIKVIDPNPKARKECESLYGLQTFPDPQDEISSADIIILAVKPNIVNNALEGLRPMCFGKSLLISVAAGIKLSNLEALVGLDKPIVRAMPNTPALVGRGATAVKSNENVSSKEKKVVEELFGTVGLVRWVEKEKSLDAVTAISGSGPAYFFLFTELLEKAAIEIGLDKELARELTFETFCGSAALLEKSRESATILREKVTSPGGTTEKALASFEKNKLYALCLEAVRAAEDRAKTLSEQ